MSTAALAPHSVPAHTTNRVLTVLFVHQSSDLYGSDRMLLAAATALQQAGGRAIVVLPGNGPLLLALQARGIEVHALTEWSVLKLSRTVMSVRGVGRLLASSTLSLRALDGCVAGRRVDLVVSHTLAVLGGVRWSRHHGVPHLWHVHEIVEHPRWAAQAFPLLLRLFAQRVVCNSAATQRWLLGVQPQLAPRTRVVCNGTEDPQSAPGWREARSLHAAFRPEGLPLAVGLVGRINRMKGHAVLLQAAQLLQARGVSNFSLVIIGDAPAGQPEHLQQLQQQIATSGLAARVVVTGFLHHTASAYAALDIVCMPSLEAESFGLVAIEAMAMGLPVVASAVGALPDVVDHETTGLLHRPGDAQDLADALGRLLQEPALRQALGQAGRQRYQRCYAAQGMGRQLVAELSQAARRPKP
jgi:glycosyltransferase involved in cell wall biosynthesis